LPSSVVANTMGYWVGQPLFW